MKKVILGISISIFLVSTIGLADSYTDQRNGKTYICTSDEDSENDWNCVTQDDGTDWDVGGPCQGNSNRPYACFNVEKTICTNSKNGRTRESKKKTFTGKCINVRESC